MGAGPGPAFGLSQAAGVEAAALPPRQTAAMALAEVHPNVLKRAAVVALPAKRNMSHSLRIAGIVSCMERRGDFEEMGEVEEAEDRRPPPTPRFGPSDGPSRSASVGLRFSFLRVLPSGSEFIVFVVRMLGCTFQFLARCSVRIF